MKSILARKSSAFKSDSQAIEAVRKKRSEMSLQIRKTEVDDFLTKRRSELLPIAESLSEKTIDMSEAKELFKRDDFSTVVIPELLQAITSSMNNDDLITCASLVKKVRILVSIDKNEKAINALTQHNALSIFSTLCRTTDECLLFEVAWVLTNMSSSSSSTVCKSIVDCDLLRRFVDVIGTSTNVELIVQIIWWFSNIAADHAEARDYCWQIGVQHHLRRILSLCPDHREMTENVSWLVSNLVREIKNYEGSSKVPVHDDYIVCLIPLIYSFLNSNHPSTVNMGCWSASYLNKESLIPAMIENKIFASCARIFAMSEIGSNNVLPSIRTLGVACSAADNKFIDYILSLGVLPLVINSCHSSNRNVKREALWLLSNVAAGTHEHSAQVVHSSGLEAAVDAINNSDAANQREALWILTNIASSQVPFVDLLNHRWIEGMINGLTRVRSNHLLNRALRTMTLKFKNALKNDSQVAYEAADSFYENQGEDMISILSENDSNPQDIIQAVLALNDIVTQCYTMNDDDMYYEDENYDEENVGTDMHAHAEFGSVNLDNLDFHLTN